ncbi:PC-esterase domain-containing protein 1A-like isoform 8-T11 [Anomaloglossus baeobatrachus]
MQPAAAPATITLVYQRLVCFTNSSACRAAVMGGFRSADVQQLLHNKYVVILGDSIQRSVYKDLVKFLQDDKFLSDCQLKRKGEFSFLNDSLIEGGQLDEMHNGTTYREVRQYRSGHHLVRFYFLTRAYSTYLESILSDFKSGPQPDVLIANSCVWDVNRYNDHYLEGYKTNLDRFFIRLKEVLSPQCLIIWSMATPVGYKNTEIPENTVYNLQMNTVEANFFSATLADFHKLNVLDMHYHFRCDLRHRCRDAVHWNQVAHRKYTHILLSHIAQSWGVEPPKGKMPEGSPLHDASTQFVNVRKNAMLHPSIKEWAHCSQGPPYMREYTSFEHGINSMSAVSPFVTDSPMMSANLTPSYFRAPPGPAFTQASFTARTFQLPSQASFMTSESFHPHAEHPQEAWNMKITSRRVLKPREGWIHPYSRPPMSPRRLY